MLNAIRRFSFSTLFGGWIDWVIDSYRHYLNLVAPAPVPLPPQERADLEARLAPVAQDLEALRRATMTSVDNRARILVPLAAVLILLSALVGEGDLIIIPVFAAIAAVGAFFAVSYRPSKRFSKAVKTRYGAVVADRLSGFSYAAEENFDPDRFKAWRFFPDVVKGRITDRMVGMRDGRAVALSQVYIRYGLERDNGTGRASSAAFHCVEIQTQKIAGEGVTVIHGRDSQSRLHTAPRRKHGLTEVALGDDWFDTRYILHSTTPEPLAEIARTLPAALSALEDELAPQNRPHVVMMPGYMAVLFPVHLHYSAFEPDPFWTPLDPEKTLASFATDLAVLHKHLMLALSVARAAGR